MIAVEETKEVVIEDTKKENGDKYWLRPFNSIESIERCRSFEGRGTEYKVKAGLELHLAKLNIRHGSWYSYLLRANIYPSTATRRMKTATKFMLWLGLLSEADKVTEHHVHDALEVIHSTPCILHDFASIKVNLDTFYAEMPKAAREETGVKLDPYTVVGHNPFKIKQRVLRRWGFLTATEQIETFLLVCNTISQLTELASHLKSLLPEVQSDLDYLQKQGKLAQQIQNALDQIRSQDWGLRELEWGEIFHRQKGNNDQKLCV